MSHSFYLNLHVVVPMRREPRESAEMLSQLLFGEFGQILDTNDSFVYIKNHFDSYEGWVDTKMILPISEKEFEELLSQPISRVNAPIADVVDESDQSTMRLTGGSVLPFYDETSASFGFREERYKINACLVNTTTPKAVEHIVVTAKSFLHSPYLWGGKNTFGIDCSGFVQVVFSINGYLLSRDASQQVLEGKEVVDLSEAKAGDLAFFEKNGKITHVGILLSSEEIIHASGQVKIERIDPKGIISNSTKKYTHHLVALKRIL